jgi:RES domain-containing protein
MGYRSDVTLMLPQAALAAAVPNLNLIAVHGPWWRIIALHHVLKAPAEPLWAGGSKIAGARFTPRGAFDSLYLSWHPMTALAEVNGLVILPAGPLPLRTPPITLFVVNGIVTRVLDLTDGGTLMALGTNEQEMTGSLANMAYPPTQVLAQAAYDSEIVAGLQYRSAKDNNERNLVVFPERLKAPAPDHLEVYDPFGNLKQRLGV